MYYLNLTIPSFTLLLLLLLTWQLFRHRKNKKKACQKLSSLVVLLLATGVRPWGGRDREEEPLYFHFGVKQRERSQPGGVCPEAQQRQRKNTHFR